jgi:probable F420-dependent oxidoreductase
MEVDVITSGASLPRVADLARRAHRAGISGLVFVEAGRTPFISVAAAALAAPLHLATGIAVAFARSPMVSAQVAWELADVSQGRFRLGLGTQVRAHVERRYSAAFDRPGPRLREYVLAVRAILRAFRNEERLSFEGEFYSFSLLPEQWAPGPIEHDRIPIDVAGVNPWMVRMAGEVADGLHVHPLNSPTYLRETVLPALAEGAARAGRDPSEVTVMVPCLAAAGDTEEELAGRREFIRRQVAYYGSTPNYAFLFDQVGFEGTTERIREQQKAGDPAGMAAAVGDDLLEHFSVSGTWAELPDRIVERYGGIADRVVLYLTHLGGLPDLDPIDRWGAVAQAVARRT